MSESRGDCLSSRDGRLQLPIGSHPRIPRIVCPCMANYLACINVESSGETRSVTQSILNKLLTDHN